MNIEVEIEKTVAKFTKDYEEQLRSGLKIRDDHEGQGWLLNIINSERLDHPSVVIKMFAETRAKIALKVLVEIHNDHSVVPD